MNVLTEYTDCELLQLLAQNNQQAFEVLYDRHWARLYRDAYIILRDADASKDIVQDLFVWLWEQRSSLNIHNLPAFLWVAVKHRIANYIRAGRIRKDFYDVLAKLGHDECTPRTEEVVELKEFKSLMQQSVGHLPPKCKEVYRLSREEQLSNGEIAEKLNLSKKTVENQMTIALRRLRAVAGRYHIFSFLLLFWNNG